LQQQQHEDLRLQQFHAVDQQAPFPWWEGRQQWGTGSVARVEGPNRSAGLAAAMAALEAGIDSEGGGIEGAGQRGSRLSPVASSRGGSRHQRRRGSREHQLPPRHRSGRHGRRRRQHWRQ
jgi:hypothetical protein